MTRAGRRPLGSTGGGAWPLSCTGADGIAGAVSTAGL